MDDIGDIVSGIFALIVIVIILAVWFSYCGDVFTKSIMEVPAFCVSK